MGDEQGYDDQFNDGLFQATVRNGKRDRPGMWPKSVSEMRQHTQYTGQGPAPDREDAHSNFMTRRRPAQESFEYGRAYDPRRAQAAKAPREGFGYGHAFDPRAARARQAAKAPREGFEYGRAYDPRRARANEGFALDRTYDQRRPRQDRFYDPKRGIWTWGDTPPQKR